MSNKTIRLRTTPLGSDKYVKLNINQEFDFIEVLSLKISQEQAYRNFCSDYGVVAGRVVINSGFGVPNARVSIFIPLDEIDKQNPQIKGLYPYEVISDKDVDGVRYNLLPKSSESENDCFTPVGTFPSKREILDDEDMMYVYEKYYKFTTSTNDAGDFMIFGVPLGNYKIHVDLDISDMGIASQRPYDSIEQGSSPSLFDSPTKFKTGTNLDRLAQIKTANTSVNVQPFWGDVDECQVGISRVDVDMNYNVTPSAIFVGGIFGDQDKYNVNNNCIADKNLGDLCLQMASEGTIEMIRKTVFGEIEKVDVKGGRLIDENGAWAYQVPMNLDYVVTNEYGSLVPSQDPTKGIPTRASVRFRIGMDNSMGGLGRLRTRAKYLVPNNPKTTNEVDYEFGTLTKDSSFRDMYWNKIYSVKNFISRYQRGNQGGGIFGSVNNRRTLALKNADGCVGDKNPLPFNRVSTRGNALFFIICLLMYIVATIMGVINVSVIAIINTIIFIWNSVLRIFIGICLRVGNRFISIRWCPFRFLRRFLIDYIPCLKVLCPKEDGLTYAFAPFCYDFFPVNLGRQKLEEEGLLIYTEIPNLTKCVAVEMAKDMDLFKYDFYNDWLNGSLYSFLVRFKKYKTFETYCDYDCEGVNCKKSLVIDSCFEGDSAQNKTKFVPVTEGIVKKNGEEYYYAATTKDARYKLYATDIISLGAVNNCDWQGLPKIQSFLKASTFNGYPIIDDKDPDEGGNTRLSGQVDIGPGFDGLFFDIDCDGLYSNSIQCKNIKHANEIGVDLDQKDINPITLQGVSPDHVIGQQDINQIYGVYLRDMLYRLNHDPNTLFLQTSNINTNFNLGNTNYDPTSITQNGKEYVDYRGMVSYQSFQQPTNSYFFYFGILPGKTGLELMNNKFFTTCFPKIKTEFLIKILSFTGITVSCQNGAVTNGAVNFSIIAGEAPFTVTTSGPNGYNNVTTINSASQTVNLTNLIAGTYTIQAVDTNDSVVNQTFEIPTPQQMFAVGYPVDIVSGTTPTGQVIIDSIIGGCGPYTATLYNSTGALVSGPVQVTTFPYVFDNLPQDTLSNGQPAPNEHFGYYVVITDSTNPAQTFTIYDLPVSGPTPLIITSTVIDVKCFGEKTGVIKIGVSGGTQPYSVRGVRTTPPSAEPPEQGEYFNGPNFSGATAGTWGVTVRDQANPPQETTVTVNVRHVNPELNIQTVQSSVAKQCDPTKITIKFKIVGTGTDGNGNTYIDLVNGATPVANALYPTPPYGGKVWYRWAIDDGIEPLTPDSTGWSTPLQANLLAGDEFEAVIPVSALPSGPLGLPIFNYLGIVLTLPNGQCISDYDEQNTLFTLDEVALAPILTLSNIKTNEQCSNDAVNIKFDISHLLLGVNYRSPYTLFYKIWKFGGTEPSDFTLYGNTVSTFPTTVINPILITQNQQNINIPIPTSPLLQSANQRYNIKFYLVDNVGCESIVQTALNIRIPQDELHIDKLLVTIGNTTYTRYIADGGIPPYKTISGEVLFNDMDQTTFPNAQRPCGPSIDIITIQDNGGNGCIQTFTKNRNCTP